MSKLPKGRYTPTVILWFYMIASGISWGFVLRDGRPSTFIELPSVTVFETKRPSPNRGGKQGQSLNAPIGGGSVFEMKIFVSHASEPQRVRVAVNFKQIIGECSDQAEVFLSSDWESIPSGSLWVPQIERAIVESEYFVLLIAFEDEWLRPWINYEIKFARALGSRRLSSSTPSRRKGSSSQYLRITLYFTATQTDGLLNSKAWA